MGAAKTKAQGQSQDHVTSAVVKARAYKNHQYARSSSTYFWTDDM